MHASVCRDQALHSDLFWWCLGVRCLVVTREARVGCRVCEPNSRYVDVDIGSSLLLDRASMALPSVYSSTATSCLTESESEASNEHPAENILLCFFALELARNDCVWALSFDLNFPPSVTAHPCTAIAAATAWVLLPADRDRWHAQVIAVRRMLLDSLWAPCGEIGVAVGRASGRPPAQRYN